MPWRRKPTPAAPGSDANFDRVARLYRPAEYLAMGPLLRQMREHFLPEMQPARNAFLLGDGDGRFAASLLRNNRRVRVTAVDTSSAMLRLLRQRSTRQGDVERLQTRLCDALTAVPPADCDLVVTHFFLDCLTSPEVGQLARGLSQGVRPGTLWVLSEFGEPHARWLRPIAALYVRALYLAFAALTGLRVRALPLLAPSLQAAGWQRRQRHERLGGLLYAELWELASSPQPPASPIPQVHATSVGEPTSTQG